MLGTAHLAGITNAYNFGGAHAIAAMAYGDPIARAVVPGTGAAPAQHGPHVVVSHFLWGDHQALRLKNLPNFLRQAHLIDETFDKGVVFRA